MSLEQTQQQLDEAKERLQTWQQGFKERVGITPDLLHDIFDSAGAYIEVVRKNYVVAGYEMSMSHNYGNEDYSYPEGLEDDGEGGEQNFSPEEDPFEATETMAFLKSWPKRSVVYPKRMILTYEAGTNFEQLKGVLFEWTHSNSVLFESLSMPTQGDWVLDRVTCPGVLFPGPKQIKERLALSGSDPASRVLASMVKNEDYVWDEPNIYRARAVSKQPAAQYLQFCFKQTDGVVEGWNGILGFANLNLLRLGFVDGKRVSVTGKFSGSDPEASVYQTGNQTFLLPRTLNPASYLETMGKLKI